MLNHCLKKRKFNLHFKRKWETNDKVHSYVEFEYWFCDLPLSACALSCKIFPFLIFSQKHSFITYSCVSFEINVVCMLMHFKHNLYLARTAMLWKCRYKWKIYVQFQRRNFIFINVLTITNLVYFSCFVSEECKYRII